MKKISFSEKLRYKFDNLMSRGPGAMILLLGIMSLLVVVIAGTVIALFQVTPDGGEPMGFWEGTWQSLMRALDSGAVGADAGWQFRTIAFIVTLGGIFILSTLIGVLGSGIESKLEELRKGRSFVIEQNHTLILGWSSKIITIISELLIANENQKNPRIVILADRDKVEMEDELRSKIGDFKNTKIICRSGIPNDLTDLSIANPQASKSIIVLASEEGNADPLTIKTILAITNNPKRRKEPYHIVAEIKEEKNVEVAKMVGKDEVELVLTDDIIARIMVQTSRQSGLSVVYSELMDFDGAEIYFKEENYLLGRTYSDALYAYEDSAVIGLQYANGAVQVNPPMDYVIENGDKIIAITEDDDTLIVSNIQSYNVNEDAIAGVITDSSVHENAIVIGWNQHALTIVSEMDNYVAPGSYLKVVSSFDTEAENIRAFGANLKNIKLEFQHADTTSRETLDKLDIPSYTSILLLCYKDNLDIQDADAQTLITLLHLRRIAEETKQDIKVVSEMLDMRNRELAEVAKADDFIVGDKLISLLMSQVSENKYLMPVFIDLFSADGSEIYLKPVTDYVVTGTPINFYTVLESARNKGETAIGYRIAAHAHNGDEAYGVKINPTKSQAVSFSENDRIIVLAEN